MSKKRKKDEENVLSEPIGHYWQRIFESGECADVLVSVRGGKDSGDEILKVSTNLKYFYSVNSSRITSKFASLVVSLHVIMQFQGTKHLGRFFREIT